MTVQYDKASAENWKWYYDNGNPYFEATIVNDWLQGRYKIWYENGQLAEELFFKDNIEYGPALDAKGIYISPLQKTKLPFL
jgi:antitoxin component YwqK of YwqJK toxin-antitoxin module